jgi:hypothetical protein
MKGPSPSKSNPAAAAPAQSVASSPETKLQERRPESPSSQPAAVETDSTKSRLSAEETKPLLELLRTYLAIYDSYHNQKETVAFAFTAFYLGGASALLSVDKLFWKDYSLAMLVTFLALIAVAGVLAFMFVRYQFQLRRSAGEIYHACNTLATAWSFTPPTKGQAAPLVVTDKHTLLKKDRLLKNFCWPQQLICEITTIRALRKKNKNWFWAPREMSLAAIVLWTIAVFVRIYSSFGPEKNPLFM